MGEWDLVIAAALVLGYSAVARRLSGTFVTTAIVFTTAGLLVGDEGLGWFEAQISSSQLGVLTTAALTVVLFADATRIDLPALREEYAVPARLLGVGLPLTIAAGTGAALLLVDGLGLWAAALLATILAPTDAALGQATVTDRRVPSRIRQGLNVESGLNDGLCVPLVAIFLALVEADEGLSRSSAVRIVAEEIGYGIAGGLVAGFVGAVVLDQARRRDWVDAFGRQVLLLAVPALAFGLADAVGGSGFIAAFVAGIVFGRSARTHVPEPHLVEQVGAVLTMLTFLAFAAVALGPVLADLDPLWVVYGIASLTLVRMAPVAVALAGTGARPATVAFAGWFGPRGLASIVFALELVETSGMAEATTIVAVVAVTVGLSIYLHGASAGPWTARYAGWYAVHRRTGHDLMESVDVGHHRTRMTPGPAHDR